MTTKTITTDVTFRRPFALRGLDGIQAAGTYRIDSYVELLDRPAATAYRRLETSIELHDQPPGITRTATIDPGDLDEALRVDALERSDGDVTEGGSAQGVRPSNASKQLEGVSMTSWFIPPIVVPVLLMAIVVAYALLRAPG